MSKKSENIKRLEEINQRLDNKANLLFIAYKNGKLNLDTLNDDMKNRILKIDDESRSFNNLKKKLKDKKGKLKTAINNINDSLNDDDDDIDENEEEPELSEKIIVKFADFKLI